MNSNILKITTKIVLLLALFIPVIGLDSIVASSAMAKEESKDADLDEEKKLSTSEHSININGEQINYTATAGYIVLKDFKPQKNSKKTDSNKKDSKSDKDDSKSKKHKAEAKVFFIAYTRKNAGPLGKRPISFSFNGGPGSASVWLHMGALGPRRAVLTDRGEALPPPYRLEDNTYSWLDKTDLVFIDPVSTGFSRAEPGKDPKDFHGYNADIESVAEFIRLYITKYKRWGSPKFVVGESYGTTRAAGLSNYLQKRYAIYLNGIVLVSSVLNFATLDFSPGNDLPYVLFLPSYAATAWYHKKLPSKMQEKPLNAVLKEAEEFASNQYLLSLFQGDRQSATERKAISEKLASFIGLKPEYLFQLNNRIPASLYFKHLLMKSNRKIGRYDSRFTGIRYYPGTERYEYDPSFEAVSGPFTATFNDYVRNELGFKSELPYETLAKVWPWKYKNAKNRYLNVAEDLRKAMSRNPYLKVLICSGYYDLATPYYASHYTFDQMHLDRTIKDHVMHTHYESGHMMYVYKQALIKMKKDFGAFLNKSILPDSSVIPTALPSVTN